VECKHPEYFGTSCLQVVEQSDEIGAKSERPCKISGHVRIGLELPGRLYAYVRRLPTSEVAASVEQKAIPRGSWAPSAGDAEAMGQQFDRPLLIW
jgi:hypothetical protein